MISNVYPPPLNSPFHFIFALSCTTNFIFPYRNSCNMYTRVQQEIVKRPVNIIFIVIHTIHISFISYVWMVISRYNLPFILSSCFVYKMQQNLLAKLWSARFLCKIEISNNSIWWKWHFLEIANLYAIRLKH